MKSLYLFPVIIWVLTAGMAYSAEPITQRKGVIKAGKIFTMRVSDKVEAQGPLPEWIPRLRRGQIVRFKIAKNRDLIMLSPRFTFKWVVGSKYISSYQGSDLSSGNTIRNATAVLRKKSPYGKAAMAFVFDETTLNSDYTTSYYGTAYSFK